LVYFAVLLQISTTKKGLNLQYICSSDIVLYPNYIINLLIKS
jgi:hypothetical protein